MPEGPSGSHTPFDVATTSTEWEGGDMRSSGARGSSRELDALSHYFRTVRDCPRLTREDEHVLAVSAGRGDASAKQALVRHNMTLVVAIARKQRRGTVRLDDLVQEGNVGLMRAVEKFDPHAGTRFST
jgi:RNA polymerase primary sigma factor